MTENNPMIVEVDGKKIDLSKVPMDLLRSMIKGKRGGGNRDALKAEVKAEVDGILTKLAPKLPKGRVVIVWGDEKGQRFSVNGLRGPRDPSKPKKAKVEKAKNNKK